MSIYLVYFAALCGLFLAVWLVMFIRAWLRDCKEPLPKGPLAPKVPADSVALRNNGEEVSFQEPPQEIK